MAATGYSPIQLYYSTTASAAPTAGNLASGELAINITDGKLYYKDNAGAVQLLSTSTTATGTANGVLYLNGSKVATSGSALTFDGTNLGVGVASPTLRIQAAVSGTTTTFDGLNITNGTAQLRLGTTGATYSYAGAGANEVWLYTAGTTPLTLGPDGNGPIKFLTNGSEAMRLTSTGLGLGTSSPGSKLDVRVSGTTTTLDGYNISNGTASGIFKVTGATYSYRGVGSNVLWVGGDGNPMYVGTSTAQPLLFGTAAYEYMRLDTSGNLGLGVTPSAWLGSYKALQFTGGAVQGGTAGLLELYANNFRDGNGNFIYSTTNAATRYSMADAHRWFTAPSGTAGNAITFTQAMTLDSSGNLLIGATSGSSKLVVGGSSGQTATPTAIQMDGTYANSDAFDKLKFYLYKSATETYGIGLGNLSDVQYWAGSSSTGAHRFFTSQTERARIDSSGNLLVGTTSPAISGRVSVSGNYYGTGEIGAYDASKQMIRTRMDSGVARIDATYFSGSGGSYPAMAFSTSDTERARIDTSGNLLVGTTDSGETTGVGFKFIASTTQPVSRLVVNTATASFTPITLYNTNATNNGYRFYVRTDGGIGNYSANNVNLSDARTKKEIQDAGRYLEKICAIPVRTFKYKDQTDDLLNLGVIAQEVEAVAPELVDTTGFGETPEDGVPLKAIYQTDLQYALMKALQELKAEFDAYKASHP